MTARLGVDVDARPAERGADRVVKSLEEIRDAITQMQSRAAALQAGTLKTESTFQKLANTSVRLDTQLRLLSVAAGAVFGLAVRNALKFEKSLSQIEGLVGLSAAEVRDFTDDIEAIGRATGKGPNELAEAMFFVTSAGARGAQAVDILRASAEAAAAGLGETADVADAVTSAVNAYGEEALSASQATDVLVASVREGKASADTIAGSLGAILPIASELGVGFDQLGGSIAALTRIGLNADEAGTALRATLSSLQKPSQQAEATLREFGTSSSELRETLREDGLLAALQDLRDRFGDNEEALGRVFPNVRATTGVLALVGKNAEQVRGIFDSLASSTGATASAFEAFNRTAGSQVEKSLASIQFTLNDLATRTLPTLARAFENVAEVIADTVDVAATFGEMFAFLAVGADDPIIRTQNQIAELEQFIRSATDAGDGLLGSLDAAFRDFSGFQVGGIELTGDAEEQLRQARERLDLLRLAASQQEREALQRERAKQGAEELNETLEEIVVTSSKISIPIDQERLDAAKSALEGLRTETEFLRASLDGLREGGEVGQGLAEDALTAKILFEDLQGQVNLTEQEVLELVQAKRQLQGQIDEVTEAFQRQEQALDTVDALKTRVQQLGEQLGAIQSEGGLEAFGRVLAEQRADEILKDLGENADISREQLVQLIETERALGDSISEVRRKLEDSKDGFDVFEEFATQAARNIQSAFADFLFDPFDDGLKGMLRGFVDTLRRLASEALSSIILQKVLGGLAGGGGFGATLANALLPGITGNATGSQFTIGGAGGTDSQLVAFRGSPGETVSVTPPGRTLGGVASGGFGQAAPQNIPAPIVNVAAPPVIVVDDPKKAIAAMQTRDGQDATVANIRANREAIRRELA